MSNKSIIIPVNNKPTKIESVQNFVIVGANGSGKSHLGAWIEQQSANGEVLRISAQRALSIPDSITIKSEEAAWNKIYYGEELHPAIGRISLQRDVYELALYEAAGRLHLPVAAICRGLQLVNVACGGTLVQDMPSQLGEAFAVHDQTFPGDKPAHPVTLEPDSAVARLFGTEHLSANSFHHQCVKELGQGLRLAGVSSDGVVEALESFDGRVVAVQFHPERMTKTYPEMYRFFTRWVAGLREKRLR